MLTNTPTPTGSTPAVRTRRGAAVAVAAVATIGLLGAGCSSDGESTATEDPTTAGWAGAEAGDLLITEARTSEPSGPNSGLFFTITNDGTEDDTFVAGATKVSPEVQIHETVKDGDTTSMQQLTDGIIVPAGETVTLEPGGLHVMLMKVEQTKAGDTIPVTLTFKNAGDVELDVPVVSPAELGGEPMGDMEGEGDMGSDSTMADGG